MLIDRNKNSFYRKKQRKVRALVRMSEDARHYRDLEYETLLKRTA